PLHDALPIYSGDLAPQAFAHVGFGVIQPKCLDLDDDLTRFGLGLRKIFNDELFRTTVLVDHNGTHTAVSLSHAVGYLRVVDRGSRRPRKSVIAAAMSSRWVSSAK